MDIRDLSRDQLEQIKQSYYIKKQYPAGVSYGELSSIDTLVSDDEVFCEYAGVSFVEEDFWE